MGPPQGVARAGPSADDGSNLLDRFVEELPFLYGFVARMGVAASDRDDIIQEVFLVFHRRRDDFDNERALRPWLSGIAYRVTLEQRKPGRELSFASVDAPDEISRSPEQVLSQRESESIAHQALMKLPPKKRAVFILHELQGQDVADVAKALRVPRFTVYSRLRQGRLAFSAAAARLLGKDVSR